MLILVTTSPRAKECSAAIEEMTHQKTQIATSLARAVALLQSYDYDALVLDESFHQTEFGAVNLLLDHAGIAMPIYVNLALHGTDRVAREVNTGLLRFIREKMSAMRSAEYLVRSELRGEVTGILLNSELALREPALADAVAAKIQIMHELAEKMRLKLEAAPGDAAHLPIAATTQHGLRAH